MVFDISFFYLSLCLMQKGVFRFNNFQYSNLNLTFITILKDLGVKIIQEEHSLTIKSHGALHLLLPNNEIDIKGEELLLYALCGIFASYDYEVFFIDSTKNLHNKSFSSIILGLYDIGVRFSYSSNFTLPLQMKGTSNLLPMKHTLLTDNMGLHLMFTLIGLSCIGRTTLFSKKYFIEKISNLLNILNIDFKEISQDEDGVEIKLSLNEKDLENMIINI